MEQAFNLCREGSNFEFRSYRHYLSQKSELRPSRKATVEVFPEGQFLWETLQVWQYTDGELRLRHKLGDHSLGVVSVALSAEAKWLASR